MSNMSVMLNLKAQRPDSEGFWLRAYTNLGPCDQLVMNAMCYPQRFVALTTGKLFARLT